MSDPDERARRARQLLSRVRVGSPCPTSWDAMAGNDRTRHCGLCDKAVYDLSAMTALEGLRLVAETEGSACVRLHRRPDGYLQTADCEAGPPKKKRLRLRVLGAAAGVALSGAAVWAAVPTVPEPLQIPYSEIEQPTERITTGLLSPPETEPDLESLPFDPETMGVLGNLVMWSPEDLDLACVLGEDPDGCQDEE